MNATILPIDWWARRLVLKPMSLEFILSQVPSTDLLFYIGKKKPLM